MTDEQRPESPSPIPPPTAAGDAAPASGPGEPSEAELGTLEAELDAALDAISPPPNGSLEEVLDRALAPSRPAPPTGPLEAAIVVLRGPDAGRIYGLRGASVVIGRSPTAQIRIDDPAVSQRHASLEREGSTYYVRDLGSANGTAVNGSLVSGTTALASGDRLTIVDTVLLFRVGEEDAGAETVHLERRSGAMAPYSGALATFPIATTAEATLSLAGEEERPASVEDMVQKAMVGLAYLRRYWRVLLILPALTGLVGLLSVPFFPPPNRAEVTVSLVTRTAENPLANPHEVRVRRPEREFFREASRTFVAQQLISETLARLDAPDQSEQARARVAKHLSLDALSETLFRGSFEHRDGDWAVRYLKEHLELFLSREVEKTLRVFQSEVDLLRPRVEQAEASLRQNEDALRQFREENLRHLPEFATDRLAAAATLEGQAGLLGANVTRLRGELKLARARLARESPLVEAQVRAADPYLASLTAAKTRLAELRARGLGAAHPEVRQAQAEIKNLERQIEATTRAKPTTLDREANPEFTRLKDRVGDLEVELAAAQAELGAVGGAIGGADETLRRLPEVEAELQRLTRLVTADREAQARLAEHLRQAETQLDLERAAAQARYEIVAPPQTVGIRLRRTLALRALLGMALGLILALGWAALTELLAIARRLPRVEITEPRPSPASHLVRRR